MTELLHRAFRHSTAIFRRLPDFLIIGAMRAGTTSLATWLAQHPAIARPTAKEIHFFDNNYQRGANWYRSHFPLRPHGNQKALTGDATPYYLFHPSAAERCFRLLPTARLVVMLRNPIDRAYSHFQYQVRIGRERLSFDEAIRAEPSRASLTAEQFLASPGARLAGHQHFSYLRRGLYADQLRRWLSLYPPESFLVISSEAFFAQPAVEYKKALDFLGLTPCTLSHYSAQGLGKYPPMNFETRRRLEDYFAPANEDLRTYLNSFWPGLGTFVVDLFGATV